MINACLEGRHGYWRGSRDILIAIATGEVAIIRNDQLSIQRFGVKNTLGALQDKLGSGQTSSPHIATVRSCNDKTRGSNGSYLDRLSRVFSKTTDVQAPALIGQIRRLKAGLCVLIARRMIGGARQTNGTLLHTSEDERSSG